MPNLYHLLAFLTTATVILFSRIALASPVQSIPSDESALETWLVLAAFFIIPFVSISGIIAKVMGKLSYKKLCMTLCLTNLILSGVLLFYFYYASQSGLYDAICRVLSFEVYAVPIICIVLVYNLPQGSSQTSYRLPNHHLKNSRIEYQKTYSTQGRKDSLLERTGSIALGLGALVAFGLLNQKLGGGSVRVSGYRRSNGTFVHSYTRHRPR